MKHVYFFTITQRQGPWDVIGIRYDYYASLQEAVEAYKIVYENMPDDVSPIQEGWIPDT